MLFTAHKQSFRLCCYENSRFWQNFQVYGFKIERPTRETKSVVNVHRSIKHKEA